MRTFKTVSWLLTVTLALTLVVLFVHALGLLLPDLAVDLGLLWFAFVPAFAFTLIYGLTVRWWRYPEGVNLFGFTLAFSVLAGRAVVLRSAADDPAPGTLFARVIVLALAGFLWQRLWLLVDAQRKPPIVQRRRGGDRPTLKEPK